MPHETSIIIDRKKKRFFYGLDSQWNDPLGMEKACENKKNELIIDKTSKNPVDKWILDCGLHSLIGKYAYALKEANKSVIEGWIIDIYPSRHLLIRKDEKRLPVSFNSVMSIMEK